ncbi:hypothetical protein [Virgibacillus ndiopensis]|uniref:hypothetical protein n=1 Tax=Virgibacillus ndiopensis TaxID=2004408 RepID=UPI00159BEDDE|nr:hypothetical protein [Virgibacillus ndiopensis]
MKTVIRNLNLTYNHLIFTIKFAVKNGLEKYPMPFFFLISVGTRYLNKKMATPFLFLRIV